MAPHDASITRSAVVPKKVLIVEDSRVMRQWLRAVLASDTRLEIVGEASNAAEARDFLRALHVDVLTLDIEMPGMNGLEFLTRLMRLRPIPVVMLSSLTATGSDAVVQALSRGAIDCVLKPSDGFDVGRSRDICDRVYSASCTNAVAVSRGRAPKSHANMKTQTFGAGLPCRRGSLFLIGASTGGVAALETVLQSLAPAGSPVVIVQHMPDHFLRSFVERLQRQLPQDVKLASEGSPLRRGDVVLAPGNGLHTEVARHHDGWYCRFVEDRDQSLHCPSVDKLFQSAVSQAPNITAALLTGLGRDGAEGMLQLSKAGATTIGQDEETSVVYGMPRVAKKIGAVQRELPIELIGPTMRKSRQRHSSVLAPTVETLLR